MQQVTPKYYKSQFINALIDILLKAVWTAK